MFSWSCGFLPSYTLIKIRDELGNEGETTKLYLDTRSFVTIGIGTMLPDAESARAVGFRRESTGAPATDQEKMMAWKKVQDLSPQKTNLNFSAAHYASMTDISIDRKEAQRLRDLKLDEFYHDLVRLYPGFDSMPEAAKIGLFDMIYNIGPQLDKKFIHFSSAVRARDWKMAAAHCDRKGIRPERNQKTKLKFLSCALDQAQAVHPVAPKPETTTIRQASARIPVTLGAAHTEIMTPYHKRLPYSLRSTSMMTIKRNDRGDDVKLVQNAVNRIVIGYAARLAVDGSYGVVTEAAVRKVQYQAHLFGDGIVGPYTKRVLDLI